MKEKNTAAESASTVCYEMIEAKARSRIQEWLRDLLEAEVTEFLGRAKSQRREGGAVAGYRNGHGKPRRLALTSGTITVRRPRVRNLAERFESRVLPLFKRRTAELGAMHCRSSICTAWRAVISSWRCAGCWARGRRCRPARWRD